MRALLLALALVGAAHGQDEAARRWAAELASPDPDLRLAARFRLWALPRELLPEAALVAALGGAQVEGVVFAAEVLAARGLGGDALQALRGHADPAVRVALAPALTPADLDAFLQDQDPRVRRAALLALARHGAPEGALLRALRDADAGVAVVAREVLLLLVAPLPPGLLAAAGADPALRLFLLRGLADRPRASATAWLEALLRDPALDPAETCLALAALPEGRIDTAMARDVLRHAVAADPALQEAAHRAAARMTAPVADSLAAAAIQARVEGAPMDLVLAALSRIGAAGEAQLLAAARTLARPDRTTLLNWLASRRSGALARHLEAAVDGTEDLDPPVVREISHLLTTQERVARIEALLAAQDGDLADAAFVALLGAGVFDERVRAFAWDDAAQRARRMTYLLGRLPRARLPEDLLLATLRESDAALVVTAIAKLVQAPLTPAAEAALEDLATRSADEDLPQHADRALILHASEVRARAALERRAAPEDRIAAYQWLGLKPPAFALEWLRAEAERLRSAPGMPPEASDRLDHALARNGDRPALARLVERAHTLPVARLREMRESLAPRLDAEQATRIARTLGAGDADAFLRAELAAWLRGRAEPEVLDRLVALRGDPEPEVALAALRALLPGPKGPALRASIAASLGGPLGEGEVEAAFELLGGLPTPLQAADAGLVARFLLLLPLGQGVAELARTREVSGPLARGAFPEAGPVAELLRHDRDGHAAPAIAAAAAEAARHPNAPFLLRARLGQVLLGLAAELPRAEPLAGALAEVLVAAADPDPYFLGPAHVLLARAAERRGDLAAARRHASAALHGFLPVAEPVLARLFLGEADPAAGAVPMARLAAEPHLLAARLALRSGDRAAAGAALAVAEDLGFGDHATRARVAELAKEISR
ncbi:MAG: hypothetical protein IT458_06915 [Planctomycetes bacterium]|nr:hypothetical protein [Planctomycetota bacterium]